jgi:hypothetical protein
LIREEKSTINQIKDIKEKKRNFNLSYYWCCILKSEYYTKFLVVISESIKKMFFDISYKYIITYPKKKNYFSNLKNRRWILSTKTLNKLGRLRERRKTTLLK